MERFYGRKKGKDIHVPLLFGAQGNQNKKEKIKK